MMHLPVRLTTSLAVLLGLGVCSGVCGRAQAPDSQSPPAQNPPAGAQSPSSAGSSSSQSQPVQTNPQGPDAQAPDYGVYIHIDPLEKVRYDNRYDLSLGFAYDHMKAGPSLLQGSNLGGLDLDGSYWLTKHWGIQGSGRGYLGTSGTAPNAPYDIRGPVVKQYFFVGGVEALGPHNKHGAITAHAMFGGVLGNFQKDLLGQPPAEFDFYYNQLAPAGIIGGTFDLNRDEHWVFRITPDAVMTHYTFSDAPYTTQSYAQYDVNFAISVGLEYKFTKHKRTSKKQNWVSGW